jgi:lipid-binding SYLF domain-containing protein
MRANPDYLALDAYLQHARGVMIFPRVYRGALLLGGEGGSGVLVARNAQGGWSAPAFYSLGAGSAGLQLGYQEATIVLVFMTDAALRSAIETGLKLGADASVAIGTMGDTGSSSSVNTAKDIYEFVDAGGAFVGVSLDGTVVGARETLNQEYYGANASTEAIVLERRYDRPETAVLKRVLSGVS